jgi:hypothetical protein
MCTFCTGERDELGGFIVLFPVDQHKFLENVAVSNAGRGKGIGKSLVQFCETEAVRLSLGCVYLYTNAKMTADLTIFLDSVTDSLVDKSKDASAVAEMIGGPDSRNGGRCAISFVGRPGLRLAVPGVSPAIAEYLEKAP